PNGRPAPNKNNPKPISPNRPTDTTKSQAIPRSPAVDQPAATPASSDSMLLLREVASRLQAQVKQKTQAVNRLHNLLARIFPELATLTQDIAVGWVLQLLEMYPTAERIAKAHLSSLEKIPFLPTAKVEALHQTAGQSVATLRGQVAETLVRNLVAQVRHCQRAEEDLRRLLTAAFAA